MLDESDKLPGVADAGLDACLLINVLDAAGAGNACHEYQVRRWEKDQDDVELLNVQFQRGSVRENGVNGVSNEALLKIVAHRLQGFQSGDFRCRENAIALTKIEEALMWLESRTKSRMARGVEGWNIP